MKTSFDYMWELLNPSHQFSDRKNACQNLWNSLSLQRQRQIYSHLRDKRGRGEEIEENPYVAINNANPHPFNWNGHVLEKGVQYITAKYNGRWGLYTKEDVEIFGLEVKQ